MDTLIESQLLIGVTTLCLMWTDWVLTILQERERVKVHHKHYESYPVNTIEGNNLIRNDVHKRKFLNLKYITISLICSIGVAVASNYIPMPGRELFLGWVWGTFLIVISTHLSYLFGYIASRRGLEGKLRMHIRTGYLIQTGRYLSLIPLLLILWLASMSGFILGVLFASVTTSVRHLLWLRRTPKYE